MPLSSVKKYLNRRLLFVAIAIGGLMTAAIYFLTGGNETTDNAYLSGNLHAISSRVPGTVTEVDVEDYQKVKKGDILVKLDQPDFIVEVHRAEADLFQAKANLSKADSDWRRLRTLASVNGMAVSRQELETAKAARDVAFARVKVAETEVENARLNLSYTTIRAPVDGMVGRKNVLSGQRVQPSQALLAIVGEGVWVTANFKETQLEKIHIGQPVTIEIDAFSSHKFNGEVESIAPASGASFSLLPPDNATGNFTRIVQRIPVRIRFDPASIRGFEDRLVPGMSATVHIKVKS